MKYRKGATNIGIMCGFATNSDDGTLHVHQTCCAELAFVMEHSEGSRKAEYDFEPVTVVYRVEPSGGDAPAKLIALHVTRMARDMAPKTFHWNRREWPRTLDFYPFLPSKAGQLRPEVVDALAAQHDLPEWLLRAAEDDDQLDELLFRPTSGKHLMNRVLITGTIFPGEMVEVPRDREAHDFLRLRLFQAEGDAPIGIRMPPGTPGYHFLADNPRARGGVVATAFAKPFMAYTVSDDGPQGIHLDILLLQASAVTQADIEPAAA